MNLFLSALLLAGGLLFADPTHGDETAGPANAASPAPGAVTAAIRDARSDASSFHLVVHCNTDDGLRRLEVFPSGVAVWQDRVQVTLDGATRRALLDTLSSGGFPSLEASYGGKEQPQREGEPDLATPAGSPPAAEEPAEGGAGPLRVRCQVTFEHGGLSKTSIQEAYGYQSPELTALADALLDRVEPIAAETGVGADDLADGLAKVASGELAPAVFSLRLVQLPGGSVPLSQQKPGTLVRIDQGTLVRRSYAPGRELGEPEPRELDGEELAALAKRLGEADLPSLPKNLWSDQQVELAVEVLGHEEAVIARSFAGREGEDAEARKRFQGLLADLNRQLLGEGGGGAAGTVAE